MLIYELQSLLAIIIFSLVHLYASKARNLNLNYHLHFLSIGSGIALAYVFIDILPKLSKHEALVNEAIWKFFPYFERHVYILALLGFLLFFAVDQSNKFFSQEPASFYLSLSSYALLNLLIGYAVFDINNPEVQPLVLFTIAISLHYFMIDYSLNETFREQYNHRAKYILVSCLFIGWLLGFIYELPATAIALVSAFIGGGVIMNVTRHELSVDNHTRLPSFLLATGFYTIILLLAKSNN